MFNIRMTRFFMVCVSLVLLACSDTQAVSIPPLKRPITVTQSTLPDTSTLCSDTFVRHDTQHYTKSSEVGSYVYTSNGSGLAVGDLNNDGRSDIAFGNLAGSVSILINRGGWEYDTFQTELRDVRALAIVDVDGDSQRELVATRRLDRPVIGQWQENHLTTTPMPDVYTAFYAMGWQDLNGDGLLDAVMGTYDTEQLQQQGLIFTQRGGGGVFIYYQTASGGFVGERLNSGADALAVAFPDLNQDGNADIMVGNDFNRPDMMWVRTVDGWQGVEPFKQTTENTMGIDIADIDNNGMVEIFATDMKPYTQDVETMARWLPAMARLTRPLSADDPQYPENTLQQWDGRRWQNRAYDLEIDASGWSWSARFGDLDNDGWQDLFVVNGMIAKDVLDYLPDNELKEPDMVFHNLGGSRFVPVTWGLSDIGSGRSMTMADLDTDGDLDIVVNPLDGIAQIYENQRCGGHRLLLELHDAQSQNPDAIGATVIVQSGDQRFTRQISAVSGYLSGQSPLVHVGLGDITTVDSIEIHWPDNSMSQIGATAADQLLKIVTEDHAHE
jgi:hypothetical protein